MPSGVAPRAVALGALVVAAASQQITAKRVEVA
jgi:hypothetical protein